MSEVVVYPFYENLPPAALNPGFLPGPLPNIISNTLISESLLVTTCSIGLFDALFCLIISLLCSSTQSKKRFSTSPLFETSWDYVVYTLELVFFSISILLFIFWIWGSLVSSYSLKNWSTWVSTYSLSNPALN